MNPKNRKEVSRYTVIPSKQGAALEKLPVAAGIKYGWLELVRLPNLFTVPGDVLAGVALSSSHSLFLVFPVLFPVLFTVLMVSLFLYISGLILNDYVDLETDRIERPRRPLPSGRVQPKTALTIAVALLVLALTLSFLTNQTSCENSSLFVVTCGLALLILFYNCLGRKIPLLGFTVMGLCRGANILLGASLGAKPFSAVVVTGAGVEAFYIAAVSSLAYQETEEDLRGMKRWVPLVPLSGLAGLVLLSSFSLLKMGIILFIFGWIFSILWPGGGRGGRGELGTGGRGDRETRGLRDREIEGRGEGGTGGLGDKGTEGQGHVSPSPRPPVPPSPSQVPVKIGKLIRALILIQSELIICGLTMNEGLQQNQYVFISLAFLVVLFFFSEWTGRRFYGS